MKRILLLAVLIFTLGFSSLTLVSCGDQKNGTSNGETNGEDSEASDTTTLSREELFSTVMVTDILQSDEESDLQLFLEEQIYPVVASSEKVTIDRLSASVYIITYADAEGGKRSILIQKFYDPVNEQIVFEKTDTQYGIKSQYLK